MYPEFRYLDGAAAGTVRTVPNDFVTIGRHPGSDLPFDPDAALEVSIRHAAVFKQGGGFLIRDLGSTNGTFLNGTRVRGDRPLEAGDVLRFGPTGPRLEFRIATDLSTPPPSAARPMPDLEPILPPPVEAARPATEERVVERVTRRVFPWKWLAWSAAGLTIAAVALFGWQSHRMRRRFETERQALLARVDSLLLRLEQARSPVPPLDSSLDRARAAVRGLRQTVALIRPSGGHLDTLARSVAVAARRHEPMIAAAGFDPVGATRASAPAVTAVVAQFRDGHLLAGSGFAIRRRGDSVWIATTRHLVEDSAGSRPTELAVVFNGTGQAFRAGVSAVHDSADLALLVTRIRGGAPVVAGVGDPVVGDPVAILGFPDGLDSAGAWRTAGARATTSVGTVTAAGPGLLELQGWGAHGSSGSPVFGPTGEVIGVVFGGRVGGPPRVLAVPGRALKELLGDR